MRHEWNSLLLETLAWQLILWHAKGMAKRKPDRRKAKKQARDLREAEAGVKSAQDVLAFLIAKADPESVKKP